MWFLILWLSFVSEHGWSTVFQFRLWYAFGDASQRLLFRISGLKFQLRFCCLHSHCVGAIVVWRLTDINTPCQLKRWMTLTYWLQQYSPTQQCSTTLYFQSALSFNGSWGRWCRAWSHSTNNGKVHNVLHMYSWVMDNTELATLWQHFSVFFSFSHFSYNFFVLYPNIYRAQTSVKLICFTLFPTSDALRTSIGNLHSLTEPCFYNFLKHRLTLSSINICPS